MGFWDFAIKELQTYFHREHPLPSVEKVGIGLVTTGVLLEDDSLGVSYTALSKAESPANSSKYREVFEIAGT
ncbi:MAG: enolase N-terminal-like fold-containing protein, partial [Candidatus Ranarchaeia archaeon]